MLLVLFSGKIKTLEMMPLGVSWLRGLGVSRTIVHELGTKYQIFWVKMVKSRKAGHY